MAIEAEFLSWVAWLFEQQAVLSFGAISIIALLAVRKKSVLLVALVLALLLTPLVKDYYEELRPCTGSDGCPPGYGFPSQHAAIAFVLAAASWGELPHLVLMPIALVISWSRLYLGVHYYQQVAGGIAFGVLLVAVAEALVGAAERRWPKLMRAQPAKATEARFEHHIETGRQLIHMMFGVFLIVAGALLGTHLSLIFLGALLSAGMLLSTIAAVGLKVPVVEEFLKRFERPGVLPGRGVILYTAGALLLFAFAPTLEFALGVLSILAIGDGLATLNGRRGWTRLPWNQRKTARGTLSFFMGGFMASVWFLGAPAAMFYSAALALAESVDWGVDDNLLIPAAGIALQALTGV